MNRASKSIGVTILTLLLILTMASQTIFLFEAQSTTSPTVQSTTPLTIVSDTERLDGWNYRKSHVIEGVVGAGTDYQVKIIVHYGTGSDSGENVYCNTRCNTNFSDIRFTDNDGTTLLDYWMEKMIEGDNATFWIEIKDDLDLDISIYVYYGNSVATSSSNGFLTFIFFDDFETGTLDRWDNDIGWSISGTYFTDGAYGAYSSGGTPGCQLLHSINQTESFLVSINGRTFANFNTFPIAMSSDVGTCYPATFGWTNVLYHDSSYNNWPQNSTLNYNTWYNMQIGFDMGLSKIRGWKNYLYMGEVDFRNTAGVAPSNITGLIAASGTQTGRDLAMDNVYIRKWVPLEPSHGTWGQIEPSDTISPTIDSPDDIEYSEFDTGNEIVWLPDDANPNSYTIYFEGTPLKSGPWNSSSESITISVDGLDLGVYNYTLLVTDTYDNTARDEVLVTVTDGTSPVVNDVQDMTFTEDSTGYSIIWSPTDLHPDSYEILLDSTVIWNGLWNSTGENIIVNLDGLSLGTYNYTVIVTDVDGNTISDTVIVTVTAETTITTTTTTNTTGWDWSELPNPLVLLITGMTGTIFILIVIVIYFKRTSGP